VLEFFISFTYT